MTRRSIRIAVLALIGVVVVGLSAEAATSGDSPSLVEQMVCHAVAWAASLVQ